ncbi:efflux RND transporter periplasmic adaptor subunit [Sandaracinus amylolyticus]|uniref:efflux RND transporter periplasmic adaptor subunit n=1 Tax=Sandaracinus amylolyticus TaxID=927083 RepID=UPI001F254BF1|nr:efflux RND transporter periplasmic adaptor subunit [Sandaracinus amylolyticus]UJR78634.1 Putative Co/Zn/Cd efflux system membrane fusion protein [Sandaracinus amylolyticus]
MSDTTREIPGLRAMAIVRWVLLVAIAALAAGTWWTYVLRDEPVSEGEARFYCPMHPQIRSATPGTCPICYMRLEPIPDDTGTHEHADHEEAPPPSVEPVAVMLTTERVQRAGIATEVVRRVPLEQSARWAAVIEAREGARAEVRVRTDAFVERLVVREPGVRVRAGQVLAHVYAPEILRTAEELRVARRWPAIPGAEHAETPPVDAALRERLALLGVAESDIDTLISGSTRTIPLRAPIAGHVTAITATRGGYATPETALFEISDLSQVRVVASASASELDLLEGEAHFVSRDGGEPVALSLELIEPRVETDTRTARVRFLARNPGVALLPGAIGEVRIEGTTREQLVVSRDAVIDTGESRYVFVARDGGLFEPRPVELGALIGEHRVITSGLEPGERVVTRGAFVLDSESRLHAALAPSEASE